MTHFERAGLYWLGQVYDLGGRNTSCIRLVCDAQDLLGSVACVGHTAGERSRLLMALLEQCLADGVCTLVVSSHSETRELAARWLAGWKPAVFTPASHSGIHLAPLRAWRIERGSSAEDAEWRRDRLSMTASALLWLMGLEADPTNNPDHALLVGGLAELWEQGEDDFTALEALIAGSRRVKATAEHREALAATLLSCLSSERFAQWTQGAWLDFSSLLRPRNEPRCSIVSLEHLAEGEQASLISLLLSDLVSWSATLDPSPALQYLVCLQDVSQLSCEATAKPLQRQLVDLVRQAGSRGGGIVFQEERPTLAPPRALDEAKTWFLGRLTSQAERQRVVERLNTRRSTLDAAQQANQALAEMPEGVFLLHVSADDAPVAFELRTQAEPRLASAWQTGEADADSPGSRLPKLTLPGPNAPCGAEKLTNQPPRLPASLFHAHLEPPGKPPYRPYFFVEVAIELEQRDSHSTHFRQLIIGAPVSTAGAVDWEKGGLLPGVPVEGIPQGPLVEVPKSSFTKLRVRALQMQLKDYLAEHLKEILYCNPVLGLTSLPGEPLEDFRLRVRQQYRERRAQELEQLRRKFAPHLLLIEQRLARLEETRDAGDFTAYRTHRRLLTGEGVASAVCGRRVVSPASLGAVTIAARGIRNLSRQLVQTSILQTDAADVREQLERAEAVLAESLLEIQGVWDAASPAIQTVVIMPKKSRIGIVRGGLCWIGDHKDAN